MVEQQTTLTCDSCGEAQTVDTVPGQAFTAPEGWVVVVIPPAYGTQLAFNRVECITAYAEAHGFSSQAPEAPEAAEAMPEQPGTPVEEAVALPEAPPA
jgi:hypothetical protein